MNRSRGIFAGVLFLFIAAGLMTFAPFPVGAKPDIAAAVDYGPVKEAVSQLIRKERRKSDAVGLQHPC